MDEPSAQGYRNTFWNEDAILGARRRIPDASVDLIVTDPPYGIRGDTLHKHYNRDERFVVDGYVEVSAEEYPAFTALWIAEAERVLKWGGALFVLSGWSQLRVILTALAATRLAEVNHIVWKYNFGVATKRKFVSSHYHLLYYAKPGGDRTFHRFARYGSRDRLGDGRSALYADMEDVWVIPREYKPGKVKNKNELPTALLAKIVQYASNPGDLVFDFFLGGFSTATVARGLGRDSAGFELNPQAFECGFERWSASAPGELLDQVPTGKADLLPRAGARFEEGEADRLLAFYDGLAAEGITQKEAFERIAHTFERGRWSVAKLLKRRAAMRESQLHQTHV